MRLSFARLVLVAMLVAGGALCYLAIADHGRGLEGTAWDSQSGDDFLTNPEIEAALSGATNSGSWKIDVLHYDSCLLGMLEDAYEVQSYARYLVASENLALSIFSYDRYAALAGAQAQAQSEALAGTIAAVTAATSPQQFATRAADSRSKETSYAT